MVDNVSNIQCLQQIFKKQLRENPHFRFSGVFPKFPFSGSVAPRFGCLPTPLLCSSESSLLSCDRKVCRWKDFQHWYNITACRKKANQTGCLLTAQAYLLWGQKDCNMPSSAVKVYTGLVFIFQKRERRIWGYDTTVWMSQDSTWHHQLSGFRKPLLFFQQGKWKGSNCKALRWYDTTTQGAHGKLSFYFQEEERKLLTKL